MTKKIVPEFFDFFIKARKFMGLGKFRQGEIWQPLSLHLLFHKTCYGNNTFKNISSTFSKQSSIKKVVT
jgi:hypothetical protein